MSYALITGGAAAGVIDGLRRMSVPTEGGTAVAMAQAFAKRGVDLHLVLSRLAWLAQKERLPRGTHVSVYRTYREYVDAIDEVLAAHGQPDYAVSTAAVSDYEGDPSQGKIPSGADELVLRLAPTGKVLDTWREKMGRRCTIVGFKLMSAVNASVSDTLAAARRQNTRARLNATLANIYEEIGGGLHSLWLCTPDGGTVRIDGHVSDVAEQVVCYLVRIHHTTWHRSEHQPSTTSSLPIDSEVRERAGEMITLAQSMNLLTDRSGNVAVSDGKDRASMLVSPRAVDKSRITTGDLVRVNISSTAHDRVVCWYGPEGVKPSIDAAVSLTLNERLGGLQALLHFHDGWVIGKVPRTRLAYPCGTLEQARVIEEAVANAARPQIRTNAFMVELRDHGHILMIKNNITNVLHELKRQWQAAVGAYRKHLERIERLDMLERVSLQPIFHSAKVVGVVAQLDCACSFYLLHQFRGKGMGEQLIEHICARRQVVVAHQLCSVEEFYRTRGFRTVSVDDQEGLMTLEPPTLRQDLIEATTVTLHCTTTDRVLLIRRGASTSFPNWWANPGGRDDDGDRNAVTVAVRELREETGIDLTGLIEPESMHVHYTGWVNPSAQPDKRECGYRVKHFVAPTVVQLSPKVDGEEVVDAKWVDRHEARSLPMGQATRATLRRIWPDF